MNEQRAEAVRLYQDMFGEEPEVVARAPGRVEVLGNHTDYNEGFVLSCAIDRDIHVAAGRSADPEAFELATTQYSRAVHVSGCRKVDKGHNWVNYPIGVCGVIRDTGRNCPAFRAAFHGTVPLGAGLSSSAALEVSTALALRKLYGLDIADEELAKLCQKAENTYSGAQCGLLDQYTSMFGKADNLLLTDFRSLEHRTIVLPSHELRIVLAISGVTHSLAESGYNEAREACHVAAEFFAGRNGEVRSLRDVSMAELLEAKGSLDAGLLKRARHIVGENERVQRGMKLLEKSDLAGFGRLLYESHQSSRDFFENSCPQLDSLVDIAGSVKGVYGARLTGGGWGGASLALLPESAIKPYMAKVTATYRTPAGLPPDIYSVRVADGAEVIS